MKKNYLLAVAVLSLFACKKEEIVNEAPVVNSITASKVKLAEGQYITLKSDANDKDTDLTKLTYTWSGTDGFSSTEIEPTWQPKKSGAIAITLTVSDGNKSVSKSVGFTVEKPNFRLGLWSDTEAETKLSETKAGHTPLTASSTLLQYKGDDSKSTDAYFFTAGLLTSAVTVYNISYTSNYSQYVSSYNLYLQKNTGKFGTPKASRIFYKTDEIKNHLTAHPELIGDAIVAGNVYLAANWETNNNAITLVMIKSETNSSVLFGTAYSPLNKTTALVSAVTTTKEVLTSFAGFHPE